MLYFVLTATFLSSRTITASLNCPRHHLDLYCALENLGSYCTGYDTSTPYCSVSGNPCVCPPTTVFDYPTCQHICDDIEDCRLNKRGSYCKRGQNPPVCFGLLWEDFSQGIPCYHDGVNDCDDSLYKPIVCPSVILDGLTTYSPSDETTTDSVDDLTTTSDIDIGTTDVVDKTTGTFNIVTIPDVETTDLPDKETTTLPDEETTTSYNDITTTDDPSYTCQDICLNTPDCEVKGSYCKDWLNPPVCQGLLWKNKSLGEICFHNGVNDCDDSKYPPVECPVKTTTTSTSTTPIQTTTTYESNTTTEADTTSSYDETTTETVTETSDFTTITSSTTTTATTVTSTTTSTTSSPSFSNCQDVCNATSDCVNGSWCKSWQTPAVCQGLLWKDEAAGIPCYAGINGCDDSVYPPVLCP